MLWAIRWKSPSRRICTIPPETQGLAADGLGEYFHCGICAALRAISRRWCPKLARGLLDGGKGRILMFLLIIVVYCAGHELFCQQARDEARKAAEDSRRLPLPLPIFTCLSSQFTNRVPITGGCIIPVSLCAGNVSFLLTMLWAEERALAAGSIYLPVLHGDGVCDTWACIRAPAMPRVFRRRPAHSAATAAWRRCRLDERNLSHQPLRCALSARLFWNRRTGQRTGLCPGMDGRRFCHRDRHADCRLSAGHESLRHRASFFQARAMADVVRYCCAGGPSPVRFTCVVAQIYGVG